MSSSCEVEHRTTSACTVESCTVAIPPLSSSSSLIAAYDGEDGGFNGHAWKLVVTHKDDEFHKMDNATLEAAEGDTTKIDVVLECRLLSHGTTVRIPPMERTSGGWSPDHFHEKLRLPDTSKIGRGVVVLLEARASECLAVALSPYHDYELGRTYVVHFGADGNTRTVLRRHINYNECVEASFNSRVCSEDRWVPYWICLQGGKLSAGLGNAPGQNCVGTLDDSMYDALRSGVDAVRYVGLGNSALRRTARDLRVRNAMVLGIPPHYGLDGVPIDGSGKFVNVLEFLSKSSYAPGGTDDDDGMPTDAELLAEYEKECTKARARAAKFGIEYKEPVADAFLKWSEARRLRANPEKGFITGIDTFSAEELAKADARRLRFAKPGEGGEKKRKGSGENGGEENDPENEDSNDDSNDEAMDDEKDDVAEWEKTKLDPLPVEQAWENWKLVKQFRVDPPSSSAADDMSPPLIVPTKIHIFAIDWACFKQIRTDDVMAYFKDYGPSYVEWLGELSCNVHFEDRHTAARAFRAFSRELPSPPPPMPVSKFNVVTVDNAIQGWAKDANGNFILDEFGRRMTGDGEEGGMPMGDCNVIDAAVDEDKGDGIEKKQEKDEGPPDYGSMGWRFCKWTVRKVSNDRYGKLGTRARVLMRFATSIDVLDDRPTEWPKPPPGFTTKRMLMPWHNFSGRGRGGDGTQRRDKNKRRKKGNEGKGRRRGHRDVGVEERISTGLRCGR